MEEGRVAKKKTLRRRKKSARRFKRDFSKSKVIKLREHDPLANFTGLSRETLSEALVACLMEGDTQAFKEVLHAFLEANNKVQIAKKMGISRKTLYNLISDQGNPTLNNIAKLLKAVA